MSVLKTEPPAGVKSLEELFAIAAREQLEVHPTAMRAATRDAVLIDRRIRSDAKANAVFLEVLTSLNSPELVLRWMNEAGVFGRFWVLNLDILDGLVRGVLRFLECFFDLSFGVAGRRQRTALENRFR